MSAAPDRDDCLRAAARCFLKAGLIEDACQCLEAAGEWSAAAHWHAHVERWHEAGECHAMAGDWLAAADSLRRAGSWEAVAMMLDRAGDRDGVAWVYLRHLGHRARAEEAAAGLTGWGPALTLAACRTPFAPREGLAMLARFTEALRGGEVPAELAERALWLAEALRRPDLALAVFTAARTALGPRWSAWSRGLLGHAVRWPWGPVAPPPPDAAPSPQPRTALRPCMVWLPGGVFAMGDAAEDAEAADLPVHEVQLSPFWIAATPVTQGQYTAVVGDNPSDFAGDERRPVELVSWHDAVAFCNALSTREGLRPVYDTAGERDPTADGYRLPTEAEWEYACRAGTRGHYWCGDDEAALAAVAWFDDNAGGTTHPVGLKPPNPFGLYDMHGNVDEWCGDGDAHAYPAEAQRDPPGPPSGGGRVVRGGAWLNSARWLRSAYRGRFHPGDRSDGLGFRLARSAPRGIPES